MPVDLSTFNNSDFKPGSSLKRGAWYVVNLVIFNNGWWPVYGLKTFLLRCFGASVGKGVVIKPYVNIKYPWNLRLGDYVWLGERVWIDNIAPVQIGSHVCLSQGALLLTGNHNFSKQTFDLILQPITLEDGVWIGARAVICGGATCGSHSVVSVGSIVQSDTEPYGVYKGNPAAKIKQRIID